VARVRVAHPALDVPALGGEHDPAGSGVVGIVPPLDETAALQRHASLLVVSGLAGR
jgi:hypothetical protein